MGGFVVSGGGGGGQWGGRGRGTGARRRVFARASRAPVAPCSVTRLAARGSGRREGLQAAAPPPLVAGARPREGCGARRGARPGLPPLLSPPRRSRPAPPALAATSRVTDGARRGARPGAVTESRRGRLLSSSRDAGTARQTTAKPRGPAFPTAKRQVMPSGLGGSGDAAVAIPAGTGAAGRASGSPRWHRPCSA